MAELEATLEAQSAEKTERNVKLEESGALTVSIAVNVETEKQSGTVLKPAQKIAKNLQFFQ